MGYSARIKIDSKHPKKDGTCAIYLYVIIDRKKKRIDLDGISWPAGRFNLTDYCRPRHKGDPDADVFNIVINNAKTKANEIRREYLLRGLPLTIGTFVREYKSNLNKNDFVSYFAQKSFYRWNKRLISGSTYEKEKGTLKRLKEYSGDTLPFYEFNEEWGKEFDTWLKRTYKNEHNSRWNRHKHVKTYLKQAREVDKIFFTDPYEKFSVKLKDGSWGPLDLEQLKKLIEMYLKWRSNPLPLQKRKNGVHLEDTRPGLTRAEVIVLRRFLFGCNTALRISDLQELDEDLFSNGQMSITPIKTERYGTKIKAVPLNEIARTLLSDEIDDIRQERSEKNKGIRIFSRYTDQSANRLLKRIARKADLDINLHSHVSRYTFASIYDEAGGNHTSLMLLMGLVKRDTLNKYVKTNRKIVEKGIDRMNDYMKDTPAKTAEA